MIFALTFVFLFVGLLLTGFIGLLPSNVQYIVPDFFRYVFFMVGGIISCIGLVILRGRAEKTGSIHLLEFGRPGTINWLYVYKDGTITITNAIRDVEGQLYSKELDAQIRELKSYRIFDHSVRIVPEGVGHSVNLDMVLYANLFKSKWGFRSIPAARRTIFSSIINSLKQQDINDLPTEQFAISEGEEYGEDIE